MKIKKTYQGVIPNNKIVNTSSTTKTDTYSCDYINKLHSYSTEEQVIGKWIDGKPLYRKVYVREYGELAQNYAINDSIDLQSWNIDEMTKIDGYVQNTANKQMLPFNRNDINFWYNGTYNYMLRLQYTIGAKSTIKIIYILEYTKTTDTGEV